MFDVLVVFRLAREIDLMKKDSSWLISPVFSELDIMIPRHSLTKVYRRFTGIGQYLFDLMVQASAAASQRDDRVAV